MPRTFQIEKFFKAIEREWEFDIDKIFTVTIIFPWAGFITFGSKLRIIRIQWIGSWTKLLK